MCQLLTSVSGGLLEHGGWWAPLISDWRDYKKKTYYLFLNPGCINLLTSNVGLRLTYSLKQALKQQLGAAFISGIWLRLARMFGLEFNQYLNNSTSSKTILKLKSSTPSILVYLFILVKHQILPL